MLQVLAEALLHAACGVVGGHGVLWALTLGRWRPFEGRDDAAVIAGLLFWVAVGVGMWLVFVA